jgi:hypothetical protein
MYYYVSYLLKDWRYQRGNHKRKFEGQGQTIQWPNETGQKDNQLSRNHNTKY